MADGIRIIEQIAARIAGVLTAGDQPAVKGEPARIAAVIKKTIVADFATEATINREAEKALAALPALGPGMDKGKLLLGLRERIAKKRGFVL